MAMQLLLKFGQLEEGFLKIGNAFNGKRQAADEEPQVRLPPTASLGCPVLSIIFINNSQALLLAMSCYCNVSWCYIVLLCRNVGRGRFQDRQVLTSDAAPFLLQNLSQNIRINAR